MSDLTSGVTESINRLGDFRTEIGLAGAALASLSAVGIRRSVSAFGDFDEAMAESLAILDDVDDEMRAVMERTARDVARETTFSAEEAASAYFFLASSGMEAAEAVEALPQMADFATAGMFSLSEAADILTDAHSALGDETLELADLSDILTAANTEANASIEQFGQALVNQAAPAMERLGVGTEEGVSALASFADAGLKGRRAGTILARTLEGVAEQGRENREAFEELGIEVFDAEGEMRHLQAIVTDMEDALGGMTTEQRDAAFAQLGLNQRAQRGIDVLMGNSEQLAEYEASLEDAGGTTEQVADRQLQTLNREWELFRSRIEDVVIGIGQDFAPAMGELLDVLTGAVGAFEAFNDRVGGTAGAAILTAGLIGGLALAAAALIPPLTAAAGVIGAVGGALAGLSTVATAAIATVGLLSAAYAADIGGMRAHTTAALEAVQRVFTETLQFIQTTVVRPFLDIIDRLWGEHGDALVRETRETWESITETWGPVLEQLGELLQGFIELTRPLWTAYGESLLETTRFAFSTILTIIEGVLDTVLTLFRATLAFIRGDWDDSLELLVGLAGRHTDRIVGIFGDFADLVTGQVRSLVDGVVETFRNLWDRLVGNSVIPNMLADIRGVFETFVSDMEQIGRSIVNGIIRGIESRIRAARRAASRLASAVRSNLPGSDAEEGPLADLTDASASIPGVLVDEMVTGASAVEAAAADLAQAASVEARPEVAPMTAAPTGGGGGGDTVIDDRTIVNIDTFESSDPRQDAREFSRALRSEGF